MTPVDRVKKLCRDRRIPISRLEKDLGFANAYISQIRTGNFRSDRLVAIAEYLGISTEYLLTGVPKDEKEAGILKRYEEYEEYEKTAWVPNQTADDEDELDATEREIRERLRTSMAYRVLFDTAGGAADSDLLEAAALIQKRKEERGT